MREDDERIGANQPPEGVGTARTRRPTSRLGIVAPAGAFRRV